MRNIDIFDISTSTEQPVSEPVLPEVGAMPADNLIEQPAVQEVVDGGATNPPQSTVFTPKSEIAQALVDNQELFSQLGIDGNRYDQFIAETLPKALETSPSALATVGTPKFYQQISGRLIGNESGGNYGAIERGSAQAFGKYQFTPQRLKDLGYTGDMKTFLKSPKDQELMFNKHMDTNYKWLINNGLITAQSTPAEVSGYLYAMHLGGYGGAKAIQSAYQKAQAKNPDITLGEAITKNVGAADSNGTRVGKYFVDGFKYGSKLMKSGFNSADDVVFNEAMRWAAEGKNELADRDQAVSKRGNAWLNTIRQYDDPLKAVDSISERMGSTRQPRGDYFTSSRDYDVLQRSGVAEEELTFWDRLSGSLKDSYGGTGEGTIGTELTARRNAEEALSKALGRSVDLGLTTPEGGDSDVQVANLAFLGISNPIISGSSGDNYERRFNNFLEQARAENPGIKLPYNSYDDVLVAAGKLEQQAAAEYEYVKSRYGGVLGGIAGFIGILGVAGDPIELLKMAATAPIGAGGLTAGKVIAGAAANTVAEIPTQAGVYYKQQEFGLNPSVGGAIANVALVGAMGGAAPVIGHYLSKGYRAVKEAFGSNVADVAEDIVQLEKNSPFPAGIDGEDKLSAGVTKANADIEAGNPVTVVADNTPVIKQDMKQQLSPTGEIDFRDPLASTEYNTRVYQEYEDAIKLLDNLGTASKEEYDAAVSSTTRGQIDQTQSLFQENNAAKYVERTYTENLETSKVALAESDKVPNSVTKGLIDTAEQLESKKVVPDNLDIDEAATVKSLKAADQLDSITGKDTVKATVDEFRAARQAIVTKETEGLMETQTRLNEVRTNRDKLKYELESGQVNEHRALYLRDMLTEQDTAVRVLETTERETVDRISKLQKQLDKIGKLEQSMAVDREATKQRLAKIKDTKGEEALKEELSTRQASLSKAVKEYEDLLNKQRGAGDEKLKFYEGEYLDDAKLIDEKTAKELIQEAREEIAFLKEVSDCIVNLGV